jgi:F-type H+-transporting ATPase subunit b
MKRDSVVVASALVLCATAALAAEGGHGSDGAHSQAAWLTLLFSAVNFSIFVFLLTRYAWPALRDFLVKRRHEVAEAMAAAERAREEAEAIRREFAAKEAALEETRRRMLEEIRQGADADRARSLREAQEAGERLRAEAARQAEHDLARARRELRAEAARLAAEIAEKEVRSRLNDADRSRLVREFVEGVSKQ